MQIVSLFCKIDAFFLEYEAYVSSRCILQRFLDPTTFRRRHTGSNFATEKLSKHTLSHIRIVFAPLLTQVWHPRTARRAMPAPAVYTPLKGKTDHRSNFAENHDNDQRSHYSADR